MKRRLTVLLLVLLCLPLTACQKQQNLYSATWFDLFDTVAIVGLCRQPGQLERPDTGHVQRFTAL